MVRAENNDQTRQEEAALNMHEPGLPGALSVAKPTSLRRRLIWGAVFILAAGAIAWVVFHPRPNPQTAGGRPGRFAQSGPMPVVTATVGKSDLDISLDALGAVTPLATVTVKTQIAGQLTEIAFQEGQMVKKGDFLVQIDPRPYQQALDQAQGQLQRDQALLKNAELDLARYKTLLTEDSIASQTVDTQAALVQQDRGTVLIDQAQVATAKLNLVYCHIIAPVGGRVGLRQVDLGNYVQTSDANGIVVITQMNPMSVVFTLPEDQLPNVLRQVNQGKSLKVTAFDRAKTTQLAVGKLDTIDNQIDPATGTVKLRAMFDNDPAILFPQQFVNVELLVTSLKDATNVPSAAVQNGTPGAYVYLVKDDSTVTVRPVKLGPQSGDRIAVTAGLVPGDKVVVDGADKLREGAAVLLPATADAAGDKPGEKAARPKRDKDADKAPSAKPQ
jgi:multidrug efflux system membrane fusion protein